MTEGTGWAARLRRVLNARLEAMSFRSGLAVFAGVLALTATGITLTVTMGGGHPAAAPPAVSASAAPSSAAAQSSAAAEPSPSASPTPAQISPESQPIADFTAPEPGTTPSATSAPPRSRAPSSPPWPTYRPMGLAPSHSLKTPGGGSGANPPPGWPSR